MIKESFKSVMVHPLYTVLHNQPDKTDRIRLKITFSSTLFKYVIVHYQGSQEENGLTLKMTMLTKIMNRGLNVRLNVLGYEPCPKIWDWMYLVTGLDVRNKFKRPFAQFGHNCHVQQIWCRNTNVMNLARMWVWMYWVMNHALKCEAECIW